VHCHCESSPGSVDECRPSQSAWANRSAYRQLWWLHSPSPFIITQPESSYLVYHPTEGRRLSRPSWLASYRYGSPARRQSPIQVLTGPGVEQLRWFDTTRYRYTAPQLMYYILWVKKTSLHYTEKFAEWRLMRQRIKRTVTSYSKSARSCKNDVQSIANGDRRRGKIRLCRCDIRRSGSSYRWCLS